MSVLIWTEIEHGQEIPPLVKHITSRQLVMWSGVSGDYNPIHYDCAFAKAHGLSGVVVHGQLIAAFLHQMLSDWHGDMGSVKKLNIIYKSFAFVDDVLTCRGSVREVSSDGGSVVLDTWVENQHGEKIVSGSAVVQSSCYNKTKELELLH